jgi:hypothetical protein
MRAWEWVAVGISIWVGLSAIIAALWVMIGSKLMRYPRRHSRRHRRERRDRSPGEPAAWPTNPARQSGSTERRPSPR